MGQPVFTSWAKIKNPALGHSGGASVQPSGSNRHSARRTKLRYDFLLRRKPFGTPLQKMTPSRTDQMEAGANPAVPSPEKAPGRAREEEPASFAGNRLPRDHTRNT